MPIIHFSMVVPVYALSRIGIFDDYRGRTNYALNVEPTFTYDGNQEQQRRRSFMLYDLHGWLTEWTCKDLTQRLSYANGTNPSYTGRISAKSTQNGGSLISTYNYSYDQLGRLISADYKQSSVTNPGAFTLADYSTAYSYDLQGNILTLERKGPERSNYYGIIDDIKATYQGNQIATLRDDAPTVLLETSLDLPNGSWSGNDFGYDANGNQTRDLSRGVADIAYNTLNRPEHVEMDGGGSIGYLYTADGTKLAEIVRDEDDRIINRRDYVGAFEYEADSIVRFSSASGYLTVADTVYHLYTPDYQGNIVAVYNTRSGSREHYKDYYPYGLPHAPMPESSSITHVFPSFPGLNPGLNPGLGPIIKPTDPEPEPSSTNRRWYGSKELTTDHGLNTYDFAARHLAPAFPRFTTVDPMAERNNHTSIYTFCSSDPINRIDPTGLADFWNNGELIGNDGIDDGRVFVIMSGKKIYTDTKSGNTCPGNNISKDDINKTKNFIKDAVKNNNQHEIVKNDWIYENCVEIEGNPKVRQKMVDVVSQDKNKEIKGSNFREYGGVIRNGDVDPESITMGEITDPWDAPSISIFLDASTNESAFHSHPSGYSTRYFQNKNATSKAFVGIPSQSDLYNAGPAINYVFDMNDKKVYIYDKNGIKACIPLQYFVTPK